MNIIGLDIGGANLKASDSQGRSLSRTFPLWKQPEKLADVLKDMLCDRSDVGCFAVTMTGELADCFRTKAEGVDRILRSIEEVAREKPVFVWQTAGEFVTPEEARDTPILVAAANWHLLATYAGRFVNDGTGLLVDIGSTTTDIIPICDGLPDSAGRTDRERLITGELVYTGVRRTPVCAVARYATLGGRRIGIAAELFATMHDVYLWQGDVAENASDCDTANGRPATRDEAADRLARMMCCDRTETTDDELDDLCRQIADRQRRRIRSSLHHVLGRLDAPPQVILVSGSGEFLAEGLVKSLPHARDAEIVSLTRAFGEEISTAACAYAAACLLNERVQFSDSTSTDRGTG